MNSIPDFTDTEINIVKSALTKRYKKDIEVQLADTELRLDPDRPTLTPCPTVYWQVDDCHLIICKIGDQRYHSQFFYGINEQFGTGVKAYNNIEECAVSLLQLQADHELSRQNIVDK